MPAYPARARRLPRLALALLAALTASLPAPVPAETVEGTGGVTAGCSRMGFSASADTLPIEVGVDPTLPLPTIASTVELLLPCSGPVVAWWSGMLQRPMSAAFVAGVALEAECVAGPCPVGAVTQAEPTESGTNVHYVLASAAGTLLQSFSAHVIWPALPAGTYTFRARLSALDTEVDALRRTLTVQSFAAGPPACSRGGRCP